MKASLRGLYAITDGRTGQPLIESVARAIQGGAAVIQYRDKTEDAERRRWEASDLLNICRSFRVPLIINDDVDLACEIGADGVHLGRDDLTPSTARSILGDDAIIGVSCYNDLERAAHFHESPVDYLAFGAFFPSPTKPHAPRADLDLLEEAHQRFDKPIVCIGGITVEHAPALIQTGASMVAVITGVFGTNDITAAARSFSELFNN